MEGWVAVEGVAGDGVGVDKSWDFDCVAIALFGSTGESND